MDLLRTLFSTDGFHPHGFCFLWRPGLIWLHVISDVLIGLAYIGIGFGLAHFVRKTRGDLPFSYMFVAFGIFIAACGATHFVEVWTLWQPVYWFAGGVKVVTAAASVFTALALPPLIPLALNTLTSARVSEKRRADLEVAHLRLKELDELKTQFFSNVSHELRTPLALIMGPVDEMLSRGSLAGEDRRRLLTVQRNAELLLRHVNDLLDVAKLQAGRARLEYRRTDLAQLVRRGAAHFESAAALRELAISVDAPEALPAEADPEQLERVVFNLLGNALKFTPAGGKVHVALAAEDGSGARARLVVHDSGPGVPEEQRLLIFEPFRQADGAAHRLHGGTGLGLAIVDEVVKLHGGTVRVEDSPFGGAAFVVELPLRAPAGTPVQDEPSSASAPASLAPLPDLEPIQQPEADDVAGDPDRPLVLVVEDNAEMNEFVAETLSEFRVARAYDGAQGLERAAELRPDLIVTDIMMPQVSGETLVREVRRVPELEGTPILLLSARADDEARLRLLQEGAQDYLTKPFARDELRARVRNWIVMKRARDVLRDALATSRADLEGLAREIAHRNSELSAALESARESFQRAEVASRAKTEFLSVMSHELRTPINAMVGYIDLLQSGVAGEQTPQQRDYLDRAKRSARHLLFLVDQVLTFAQFERGGDRTIERELDLREILKDAAELVEPGARERGLTLEVRAPDEPVSARTDPGKLRQIVLNLAANAVKFTEEGRVELSLESDHGAPVITVMDTGPGIPEDQLQRIFEPFWRADRSERRLAGGTGLGLAIAKRLAGTLGADLDVRSRVGEGTTFRLRLPASPPEA